MSEETSATSTWDHLNRVLEFRYRTNLPKVSVVIPTFNNAQLITGTIESLCKQKYADFEIIIIDAGSRDRTLEIVDSFHSERIRIFSAASYNRYKMWNQGASLARGEYINFIYPGACYLWCYTLAYMMNLAEQHKIPDMVYCGSMKRQRESEPKTLYLPFGVAYLQKGLQPTSLGACWFRSATFQQLRGFNTEFPTRGGLELLCRIAETGAYRCIGSSRVLADHVQVNVTQKEILNHFWDTLRLVRTHFGWGKAARWLLEQRDWMRFASLWFGSLRTAFLGR